MEVGSPVEENVAAGAVTENREPSINADEDLDEGLAVAKAECEPLGEYLAHPAKDDETMTLAEDIDITKPCSQIDSGEISNTEAMEEPKAIDAAPQKKELENAEITLVVEMVTDAELAQDSKKKEEGSIERDRGATSPVPALEQVSCEDFETGIHGITSEAAENIQQQKSNSITFIQKTPQDSSTPSKMHETVGKELERTDFSKEVVIEELAVTDEVKSFVSKREEEQSVSLVQKSEASANTHNEETLGNLSSGSLHRLMTSEEERAKLGLDDLADMKVEAGSSTRPCRKRAAEVHGEEDGLHTRALSEDLVDGERKKGRMAIGLSVQSNAQGRVMILERRSDSLICTEANDEANVLQCLESDSGEKMKCQANVVKRLESDLGEDTKEESSSSTMVQTEQRLTSDMTREQRSPRMVHTGMITDRIDLETEDIQKGSSQSLAGRGLVQEGTECVGGTSVLTAALGEKDAVKELGNSHVGMDTNTAIDTSVGIVVEEGTQKLFFKKELGALDKNSYLGCAQPYLEMESGAGLEAMQEVMEGMKSPQGNNEVTTRDEMDVSACHIELPSSKESSKVGKGGREAQGKEATSYLFGLDSQVSSADPGLLQSSRFDASEISHTDVFQLERQPRQKAHAEIKVRPAETHHETMKGISGRGLRELSLARSKEEEPGSSIGQHFRVGIVMKVKSKSGTPVEGKLEGHKEALPKHGFEECQGWGFQGAGYENGAHSSGRLVFEEEKTGLSDEANTGTSEEEKYFGGQFERGLEIENVGQKRKLSENLVSDCGAINEPSQNDSIVKKAKKKAVNVWAKTTSRKGPKKNSKNGCPQQNPPTEDSVLLTPVYVNPDKVEDGPDQPIALSKYDKAEKIELSESRLSASSTKGYRMVRATRGVQEGTWYYEIAVEQLGPTGHTRLGWSTQKGDVQAPVGFDSNSYGYRDLDGSKTHVAVRESYGDLYVEGDVIGFYIHLPNGAEYTSKPAPLLSYRGRPHLSDVKEEQPGRVPGSEICFFRNGVCQGTAFKDIYGGRYFPAASMYTLPKEPSCTVRFNFGPDFRYPPVDLDDRPAPKAMVYAPYHNALSGKDVGPGAYANVSSAGLSTQNIEPQMNLV